MTAESESGLNLLSVGAVAARLGVAPETLRSWGSRYGLTPSQRSAGGHRRYSGTDLAVLVHMQRLVNEGLSTAQAARRARQASALELGEYADQSAPTGQAGVIETGDNADSSRPDSGARRSGGGGRILAVPGATAEVRGLARAAVRLDAGALMGLLGDQLAQRGVVRTWDEVLRPVLVAAGQRWARTGEGVELEHVLSNAAIASLRAHQSLQPRPAPSRPVLLANAREDLHVLPLYVLAAALAERRVLSLLLGSQVPEPALIAAVRRTRPSAVFIWRQRSATAEPQLAFLPPSRPTTRVVLGGPGWRDVALPLPYTQVASLREAVTVLAAASASAG